MISITFRLVSCIMLYRRKRIHSIRHISGRGVGGYRIQHISLQGTLSSGRCDALRLNPCARLCLVILQYLFWRSESYVFSSLYGLLTLPRIFEMLMAFDALRLRNVIQLFGLLCTLEKPAFDIPHHLPSDSVPRCFAGFRIHRNPRNQGCVVRAVRRLAEGRTISHRSPHNHWALMVCVDVVREVTVP